MDPLDIPVAGSLAEDISLAHAEPLRALLRELLDAMFPDGYFEVTLTPTRVPLCSLNGAATNTAPEYRTHWIVCAVNTPFPKCVLPLPHEAAHYLLSYIARRVETSGPPRLKPLVDRIRADMVKLGTPAVNEAKIDADTRIAHPEEPPQGPRDVMVLVQAVAHIVKSHRVILPKVLEEALDRLATRYSTSHISSQNY